MTNMQIIATECELNGVTELVDTYQGWSRADLSAPYGEKETNGTKKDRKSILIKY